MASKKTYHRGKIDELLAALAARVSLPEEEVRAMAAEALPEVADRTNCQNCGANMEMRTFIADMHVALLLIKIGEAVRTAVRKGIPFTDANKVHVVSLPISDATRHSETAAKYLNFIEQPNEWRNSGFWVITWNGWNALKGRRVKKTATWFRKKLISRGEEDTTLAEMFRTHRDKVEKALARGRAVRSDRRADVSGYDPVEWSEFGGYGDGKLL